MNKPIYMDYNATTPVAKEVMDAMLPYFEEHFGNPSSAHIYAQEPKRALSNARAQIAELIGATCDEIIFTSGGTESNNMVLKGIFRGRDPSGFHIITSRVEHPSVLNPLLRLVEKGLDATFLPVEGKCMVEPGDVRRAIKKNTVLISIMLANNETGTIQPIKEISEIAREFGVLVHTDAAQAMGKIPVHVNDLGVDLMTLAGHKFYAPKGIGALFIRQGTRLDALLEGGGQERGLRPGTENVPYMVGLGRAALLSKELLDSNEPERIRGLSQYLLGRLRDSLPDLVLNGDELSRLPNTLNISIPGLVGAEVLEKVKQVFVASTGAACHDRSVSISHVLAAMGVPKEVAMGAIRISMGRYTTRDQVEQAASELIKAVQSMPR